MDTPDLEGGPLFLPVAADDEMAKKTVIELGAQLGFDAVDAGPLANARYLEPVVELLVHLAFGTGLGTGIGFTLARA
jgi:8-hydroxy-5-deazaflavin:NADPH oxidoreductase